ncbi:hypothetical protein [Mycobacterium shigaense]|uniref:Uncharacterized protein n=1 Tax=Mycobacterium shigaense TaxID=722731 RepID=A0A1Z4EGE0_9MYCO|nr:hypothetical protein [Mycobacterium shigaense]PRI16731.1 hypothetical protein B2J96_03510 [Mycobacterium shigaense]BAX92038.1 hypothetical protein MSG_01885 [Mycobacterium shigaense]
MTEVAGIKGTALDTRLKHSLLTDPVLQAELSGEEFRAWVNLTVWVVSLVSDGAFSAKQAIAVVSHLDHMSMARFIELGLVEHDDELNCRMVSDHWEWQSTREQITQMSERRRKNRERQAEWRARGSEGVE